MRLSLCVALLLPAFLAVGATSNILDIAPPIRGLTLADLRDGFQEIHNGHRHEAIDIMEPRGTPVHAVVSGTIGKLFLSKPGGNTIYQFDETGVYCYYYAHLDRYVEGLREGMRVERGGGHRFCRVDRKCGCARAASAFAIFELGPEKQWWKGNPVDPYLDLVAAVKREK